MNSSSLTEAVRIAPQPESRPPALDLIDDIEGVRVRLSTSQSCRPTRCSTDSFLFPVDVAYDLAPVVLWTHRFNPVIVRDTDGVRAEITDDQSITLSPGQYTIDICSLGLKVYLLVHGAVEISYTEERGRVIDCSGAESVTLGLRSFHEAPSATVTTTDQPRDIMRALSCLGSSLKTLSCERSFPTLRGHPPLFERGERFHAPSGLERTDETASVRIEVPPTLETVYPVAPLAYYLNAVVVPGDDPRIVFSDTTYALDQGDGVANAAEQLLKHVFTLDCITRTDGLYPITLGERETLEKRLINAGIEIDFTTLYEQSLPEQLRSYVSIPFDCLADLVPRWPLTADVWPVPKHLQYLPFLVASLGTIRCFETNVSTSTPPEYPEIEAFCRTPHVGASGSDSPRDPMPGGFLTRSPDDTPNSVSTDIHGPPESDSIAQLWLADGYPIQGTKPTLGAFERRFDTISGDEYEVAVISNNVRMEAESDVAELYRQRDRIPFDVTIHEQLSRRELRAVFTGGYDLVHYVGHVDEQGLQCADGWLDARTFETVETRMFVLNGCCSYEQGMALIDAGAIGGLCTITKVGNTPATRIGRTVARLVNTGFSLGGALDIIGEDSLAGQQYMIVGDPGVSIVTKSDTTSILAEITPAPDSDEFVLQISGYPSVRSPIGMVYAPAVGDYETYYLNSGQMTTITVSSDEITEYLAHDRFPVRLDGELVWSDKATIDSPE